MKPYWVFNLDQTTITNSTFPEHEIVAMLDSEKQLEIIEPRSIGGLSFGDNQDFISQLDISPNPANDIINISFSKEENCHPSKFILRDFLGKSILNQAIRNSDSNNISEKIDVANFSSGVYILQILTTQGIVSEKVIIAH